MSCRLFLRNMQRRIQHPRYPRARAGLSQLMAIAALVGVTSATVGAAHAELGARIDEQQILIAGQHASLAQLRPLQEAEIESWRSERDRITGQLAVFDKLDRNRRGVVPTLEATLRGHMLPPRRGERHVLWVSSYRESGGYLSLQGGAFNNADISEFMRALQREPRFSDVQLCFTRCNDEITAASRWYPFEVGMKVDYSR